MEDKREIIPNPQFSKRFGRRRSRRVALSPKANSFFILFPLRATACPQPVHRWLQNGRPNRSCRNAEPLQKNSAVNARNAVLLFSARYSLLHMVRACLPQVRALQNAWSRLKATRGKYPTSSKSVKMGKKIAIGGNMTEIMDAIPPV